MPISKIIIGLDTETTGVDFWHGARPFLVTVAHRDGTNTYWEWPVDPLTRNPVVLKQDLQEIADCLERADCIALQNAKFDYRGLQLLFEDAGMVLPWDWSKVRDTLMAGHLLASNQPHDLTTMAMVYLNVDLHSYELKLKQCCQQARRLAAKQYEDWQLAKPGLSNMPSAKQSTWKFDLWLLQAMADADQYPSGHPWRTICAEYANSDSMSTLALWLHQRWLLRKERLYPIFEERMRLLPIIVDMEERGVTINHKRLEELTAQYQEQSQVMGRICMNIAKSYDYELELPKSGNNSSLRCFLLDVLKIEGGKKSKKTGEPSLDKSVLESLEDTLPSNSKPLKFVKSLRAKRSRDTALVYMEGYRKFWLPHAGKDWFVLHPSVNPTGTHTLRWSSSNPNEQNISKKEGFNLRYCFGPALGREWWAVDYDNLELRIPAYESGEEKMIELFERPDDPPFFGSYHLLNASIVYPELFWPLAEKKGAFKQKYEATYYKWIKNGGFAKQYGAQPSSADRTFRRNGAYDLLSNNMPRMEALNQKMIELATRQGYVETIPDKTVDPKRGYPIYCSLSQWGSVSPTIPLNYHVQSTAMWCTMKAMIRCQQQIDTWRITGFNAAIAMQVHDEIVFDFPAGGKENLPRITRLRELMEQSGADIEIPLKCSVTYHPKTWSNEKSLR